MLIKHPFDISATWQPLPDYQLLIIDGPDAIAFAQNQFMNDVKVLQIGHWQWNGWLSPKGRVIALFALIRTDENSLWAIIPDMPAQTLAEQLQRFVFRSKVKLDASKHYQLIGCFDSIQPQTDLRHIARHVDGSWLLDFSGDGAQRSLGVVPIDKAVLSTINPTDNDSFVTCWFEADIRHGLPRLVESQRDVWTPQMLSLDRLGAFSVRKGCYPGQEIVARTHFLGKNKRSLGLIYSDENLSPGQIIHTQHNGNSLEFATIVTNRTNTGFSLAVIKIDEYENISIQNKNIPIASLFNGLTRLNDFQ